MNRFPLVSVIIPVYNRAEVVGKTMQNIFDNNYRPIELILINDGSTDNSLEVLNDFKKLNDSDSFIVKVLNKKNEGAPAARNLGYVNSKGDYIQFLDSDDLISPEKFERQVDLMQKDNADFALCDFKIFYIDEDNRFEYHSNKLKLKKVLKTHGSFGCGSSLLHRDLSNKIEWDEQLKRNQDVDYFLKASLLAKNIVYDDKPYYSYIRHSGDRISASYSKTAPVYLQRISSLNKILKYKYNRINIIRAIVNLYFSYFKYVTVKVFRNE